MREDLCIEKKKAQLSSDSNALHISFFPLQISYFFFGSCVCVSEKMFERESEHAVGEG